MLRKLKIKDLAPRKDASFLQGYYRPINPLKYMGDCSKIIFRSSYEKKFATYCDLTERVVSWASEPVEIPYVNPISGDVKPYNVDFYVKLKDSEGFFKEYLIEVKPERQLKKPQQPRGKDSEKKILGYTNALKTYLVNIAKFSAAAKYAEARGWSFLVVTEKFIFS